MPTPPPDPCPTCGRDTSHETGIRVCRGTREKDGGCNFCSRNHRTVVVMRSPGGFTARACLECLKEIKETTR